MAWKVKGVPWISPLLCEKTMYFAALNYLRPIYFVRKRYLFSSPCQNQFFSTCQNDEPTKYEPKDALPILGKLWLIRQELTARDFDSAKSTENAGILCVFPIFSTAWMGQKIRCSAADDLFRGSLKKRCLPLNSGKHPGWKPYCSIQMSASRKLGIIPLEGEVFCLRRFAYIPHMSFRGFDYLNDSP